MAAVEIKDVKTTRLDNHARLWNAAFDLPKQGAKESAFVLQVAGWLLTRDTKPAAIEIYWGDLLLHRSTTFGQRPDVEEHFRNINGAMALGFSADVNLLLFPETFELTVKVCFSGPGGEEYKDAIGVIRGQRQALALPFTPTILPLSVYGLGRSGTTLLMQALGNHPQVVVYDQYPYEVRMMSYMLQVFGVMTARADHANSSHPDTFPNDFFRVGFNPYHHPGMYNETMINWFSGQYLDEAAGFTMRSTEKFYQALAEQQQKAKPRFFAEKTLQYIRNQLQWVLYPQSRGVLLVRDLRDRHCSIQAFNEKRGFASFGFEKLNSEEQFITSTESKFQFNWANWKQHPQQVRLVRYEDLIRQPHETLTTLTQFLGLDSSPNVIEQMFTKAQQDTPQLQKHRTTENADASIGRWKRDLDPKIAELYRKRFGRQMQELGYDA